MTFYNTISDSLETIREYGSSKFMLDGLAFIKYIHDKVGPGTTVRQLASKMSIMDEKQSLEEDAEQFADRLEKLNSKLQKPVDESILCQLLLRGVADSELKKFLVAEQLHNSIDTYDALKQKIGDYTCRYNLQSSASMHHRCQ